MLVAKIHELFEFDLFRALLHTDSRLAERSLAPFPYPPEESPGRRLCATVSGGGGNSEFQVVPAGFRRH